jgi:hypothetical protein
MAAKNLAGPEWFHGSNPGVLRVMKLKVGKLATDDVVLTTAVGTQALFNIPAGTLVHDLQIAVLSSFKSTGGTVKIGDTNTSSGYFLTTQFQAKGTYAASLNAGTFKHGKYYASAQNINIVTATKPVTLGEAEIFITYSKAHADV